MVKTRKRTSKRRSKRRIRGGFAGVLKEANVPIAFLSGNVKLKKKVFNNKTIMIPIFKNLNHAKLNRDKKRTKRRRVFRRNSTRVKRRRRRRR